MEQEPQKQKMKEQEEIARGREKSNTLSKECIGKNPIKWQKGREMGGSFLLARQILGCNIKEHLLHSLLL